MSQSISSANSSERLISLLLLNTNIKDHYTVTKKLEQDSTVIQIINRIESNPSDEQAFRFIQQ